jgi:hypothetical protein
VPDMPGGAVAFVGAIGLIVIGNHAVPKPWLESYVDPEEGDPYQQASRIFPAGGKVSRAIWAALLGEKHEDRADRASYRERSAVLPENHIRA